jgi:outer membrane murein-binding lipoprotein Lpp
MNKWLIIWNVILTILLLSVALGGCSASDSRVDWAITQIQTLSTKVSQLQSTVDYNTQVIQGHSDRFLTAEFTIRYQSNTGISSSVGAVKKALKALKG